MAEGAPPHQLVSICHSLSPLAGERWPARQLANYWFSPVAFNDIKRLARSMPADGLEAQDVVPPRCGCWVAHMAIFVAAIGFWAKHKRSRAGPPRPAFPAFLAGAGRPLLPSMIDYSVFSLLAAARGSTISGPISRSATAFNFCIQGQIRPLLHLVNGSQGVRGPFRVTPPLVPGERPGFPPTGPKPALQAAA